VIYTKDRIQRIGQAFFSAILLYLLLATAPVLAQEQDLQETLQRLESLLEQQQQELQVQRRELAEQRALIKQLQESQKTEVSQPGRLVKEESPVSSLAEQTSQDGSPSSPVEIQDSTAQQLADTDTATTESERQNDGVGGHNQWPQTLSKMG